MLLNEWLRRHDGIAHTSAIRQAGFSSHAILTAVDDGRMLRVRRSWIALRECEPSLLRAIGAGGRLTCVSAARRLGLWVPEDRATHIAAPSGAGKTGGPGLRVHWSSGPAPADPRAPVLLLVNVLHHAANCLEMAVALAMWESSVNRRLIDVEVLRRIGWKGHRSRRLATIATGLSDSGLETEFLVIMRMIGVTIRQQIWIDGRPVDALIGERLVVQMDGFAHHADAAARRRDIDADARLRLRGYTVLRFDYHQIFFTPELVKQHVLSAIAQGLHLAG
nr:DUF559 domain-containing protein [uncultured Microbacterium sp.]